jgi:hypothetical protein
MVATAQDFSLYAGDNAAILVTLRDAKGGPLDLNGATLIWGMAPISGSATLRKSSALPSEIEVVDEALSRVAIYLVPIDTVKLSGQRQHELRIIDASGAVETVMVGTMTINHALLQPLPSVARLRVVS